MHSLLCTFQLCKCHCTSLKKESARQALNRQLLLQIISRLLSNYGVISVDPNKIHRGLGFCSTSRNNMSMTDRGNRKILITGRKGKVITWNGPNSFFFSKLSAIFMNIYSGARSNFVPSMCMLARLSHVCCASLPTCRYMWSHSNFSFSPSPTESSL